VEIHEIKEKTKKKNNRKKPLQPIYFFENFDVKSFADRPFFQNFRGDLFSRMAPFRIFFRIIFADRAKIRKIREI